MSNWDCYLQTIVQPPRDMNLLLFLTTVVCMEAGNSLGVDVDDPNDTQGAITLERLRLDESTLKGRKSDVIANIIKTLTHLTPKNELMLMALPESMLNDLQLFKKVQLMKNGRKKEEAINQLVVASPNIFCNDQHNNLCAIQQHWTTLIHDSHLTNEQALLKDIKEALFDSTSHTRDELEQLFIKDNRFQKNYKNLWAVYTGNRAIEATIFLLVILLGAFINNNLYPQPDCVVCNPE